MLETLPVKGQDGNAALPSQMEPAGSRRLHTTDIIQGFARRSSEKPSSNRGIFCGYFTGGDLTGAQILLEHSEAGVTQISAERDMTRVATVAAKMG